jgi:ribulose-phosphate 3-epimerase
MTVYPAILSDSPEVVAEQLELAQFSDDVEVVQIDIIDGWFADNVTVTPTDLVGQEFGELAIDLHLMTEEPLDFVYEARDCKESLPIRAIIAQVEHLSNQLDFLKDVRNQEWKAGLSLNLFTPIDAIDEESWEYLDIVQVMGIEAGFQGQTFHPAALDTVRELAKRVARLERPVEIVVDGGVTLDLIGRLQELGVSSVAVGSGLWRAPDVETAIRQFAAA